MFVARCCGDTLRRLERVTARSGVSNEDNLRVPQQRIPTDRMALKDSSDNEAVRSRGQDLVSTQQCERKIKLQNKKERPKKKCVLRPFLTQSDYASRKRPFSTGLFFDWVLLVLLIVGRSDSFVLFLEAVGVRAYCCTAVEIGWQLCASRFLRKQRLDKPSSQRVGGFGLSRKPPKLRSWSHTQPRAVKATAGAAVVGSMGSIPCAAAVV